jgi:hypothetical protein
MNTLAGLAAVGIALGARKLFPLYGTEEAKGIGRLRIIKERFDQHRRDINFIGGRWCDYGDNATGEEMVKCCEKHMDSLSLVGILFREELEDSIARGTFNPDAARLADEFDKIIERHARFCAAGESQKEAVAEFKDIFGRSSRVDIQTERDLTEEWDMVARGKTLNHFRVIA